MSDALTMQDFMPLAQAVAEALEAQYDHLCELDAAMGDGDLGVTCRLGMQAVLAVEGIEEMAPDAALLKAGMAFNAAGASTFGALVASAAMGAAAYARREQLVQWALADIATGLEEAILAIQKRGGAEPGQKTLLDALFPALEALREGLGRGDSLAVALTAAAEAARAGVEATKPLKSSFGRAAWLQDNTIGKADPGAAAAAIVLHALAGYVEGRM